MDLSGESRHGCAEPGIDPATEIRFGEPQAANAPFAASFPDGLQGRSEYDFRSAAVMRSACTSR